jgi:hypothetical protein
MKKELFGVNNRKFDKYDILDIIYIIYFIQKKLKYNGTIWN